MQAQPSFERRGALVLGTLLILAGAVAVAMQLAGLDPWRYVADEGWPLFVIVPGVALLAASVLPPVPQGAGLAIAGSIVTIVGLVLLYQNATDHWESWAYAWALVGPGGAGVGMLLYGLAFRQIDLAQAGLRLVGIAAVIFVVGFLFFESVFGKGRVPAGLETWWPFGLVALGIVVLLGGLFGGRRRTEG